MNPYPTDQEDELWLIEEGKGENGRNIASLAVYQICMKVGEVVWKEVDAWPFFAKDTIGKQIVKSSDSIAANLAEGHGRYSFKENLRFCFYARGSLVETQTWLQKANNRDLLSEST
ncbi:MAG: four helix bundle protein, partial [Bacteroidota bacterium]